jgi:hypothetical protein
MIFNINNQKGASKLVALAAIAAFSLVLLINPMTLEAQNANDTVTLDVNISQVAAIEVLPTALSWNGLSPGSNGSVENISVKNIGSYNLSDFYAVVDTEDVETQNPVSAGNITLYAAGGFMLFRNESSSLKYYHLGRLEWNLSEIMDTEVMDFRPGTTNWAHGWYRQANGNEYLWKLENGTDGWCNDTLTQLTIKKNPENSSGYSRDLSANYANATPDTANENWTMFYFPAGEGGPLQGHCVASYYDCSRIYIYKYNMDGGTGGTSFGACDHANYFSETILTPGERLDKIKIKPSIPFGIPSGDASQGILTIFTSTA